MNEEQYFNWWMENRYPHKGYVNALSRKWIIQFAKDWTKYSKEQERQEREFMSSIGIVKF